ncbi:hypothetical protein [Pseudomonas oryzihabitans]|uniref:hypothetical protein n=1 Tax=Pseudomonas oryzihabitans TaxID=47885 RepID=UPI003EB7DFCD
MINIHFDLATQRRICGWAYDSESLEFPSLFIKKNEDDVGKPISSTIREDVAEAKELPAATIGFDLIIPDAFDEWVDDYLISDGENILFRYSSALEALFHEAVLNPSGPFLVPDFNSGRHVCFIYEKGSQLESFFKIIKTHRGAALFPTNIGPLRISFLTLHEISDFKKQLISCNDLMIVCPGSLLPGLNSISPSLSNLEKFVVLFEDVGLESKVGLHKFKLNNFFLKKTRSDFSGSILVKSLQKLWSGIEQYQDLFFDRSSGFYFFAYVEGTVSKHVANYIRSSIQGVVSDDLVRIKSDGCTVILLRVTSYIKIFDYIGSDKLWMESMARGLSYRNFVL